MNRPPTRVCSTCSHELDRDNLTNQCRECRLVDRNRRAEQVERGRQLALGEVEHQGEPDPDDERIAIRDAWAELPDVTP